MTSSEQKTSFEITTDDIFEMLSPPSIEKYAKYGYAEGLSKLLKTDINSGLYLKNDGKLQKIVVMNGRHGETEALNPSAVGSIAHDNLEQRIAAFGDNRMPEPISKTILQFVLDTLKDKTLILLCFAAAAKVAVGIYEISHKGNNLDIIDGIAVILAVLIVVTVTSVSDYGKQGQFKKLNDQSKSMLITKVFRNGEIKQIHTNELLVGDICQVETGDVIPADAVLIKGYNISADESSLTGEPMQVEKNLHEDPFLLSGTKIVQGVGKMMIVSTGIYSLNGRSILALEFEPERTPLQEKLEIVADTIAKFGIISATSMVLILIISYLAQTDLQETESGILADTMIAIIISGITLIVVAVPEGLPLAVTLGLSHATVNMLKENNLVRHLGACETMGNATTICSDKTGTLTLNQMSVVNGIISDCEFDSSSLANGDFKANLLKKNMSKVLRLACLSANVNSSADEQHDESNVIKFMGSKTEIALLNMTKQFGFSYKADRAETPVYELYPFSSELKSMATLIKIPADLNDYQESTDFILFYTGAAEIMLEKCDRYLNSNGEICFIDPAHKERLYLLMKSYNEKALRTICQTFKFVDRDSSITTDTFQGGALSADDSSNCVLMGLVGILDPLRPEVPEAVKTCQKAGIMVRMVTGDSVATAQAIAKDCGILTGSGVLMEGPVFRKLPEAEMLKMLPKLQVLARSSPLDKQILVNALKKIGETVAVTGDGTNDAPALKSADVGFSMGISGTEVSKEASDIVLLDDNFASIVKAVIWGRSVYDSVRKFLQFQLSVNVSAVVVVLSTSFYTAFTGNKVPVSALSAIQLLWVNLIMNTFAALALATDPPTPDLLNRKPSKRTEYIISPTMGKMIICQAIYQIIACFVVYFAGREWFTNSEMTEKQKVTYISAVIFNMFVFCQIFNEFNCRSITNKINIFSGIHKNPSFIMISAFTIGLQAIIIQFGGQVFKVPVGGLAGSAWALSLLVGLGSLPLGLLVRFIPDIKFSETSSSDSEIVSSDNHQHVQKKGGFWNKSRVVKAFRPADGSNPTLSHNKLSMVKVTETNEASNESMDKKNSPTNALEHRRTSIRNSFIDQVRGGRSSNADICAFQVADPNTIRERH